MAAALNARCASHRLLCVLLAILTVHGLPIATLAQLPGAEIVDRQLRYVVPGACAAVVVRPKQVFAAEVMRLLPWEVIQAAGVKEMGIDPLETQQIVVSVAPPLQGPPAYAVHATFAAAYQLKRGAVTEHTAPGELDGRKYWKSQQPLLPSFFAPDDKSLLAAPEYVLKRLVESAAAEHPLASQVGVAAAGADLYALVDLEALRPLIGMALSQIPADFPEEARPLLEIPNLLKSVELTVNVSNASLSELVVSANSEVDAEQVETLLQGVQEMALAAMVTEMEKDQETQRLLASEDPVEQAMGRYARRLQSEVTNAVRQFHLPRDGAKFNLVQIDPTQVD